MKPSSMCPVGKSTTRFESLGEEPYELHAKDSKVEHKSLGNIAEERNDVYLEELKCSDKQYVIGSVSRILFDMASEQAIGKENKLFLDSRDRCSIPNVDDSSSDTEDLERVERHNEACRSSSCICRSLDSHPEMSSCNAFKNKTNCGFPDHNKDMVNNKVTQKSPRYDRMGKDRSRLETALKKSVENYLGDSNQVAEMDGICKKLSKISRKKAHKAESLEYGKLNDDGIDRFKRYFQSYHANSEAFSPCEYEKVQRSGTCTSHSSGYDTCLAADVQENHPDCLEGFVYKFEDFMEESKGETLEDKMPDVVEALKTSNVVLVKGDTGCGKTTQIPKLLMSQFGNIVCTQPRRLAAVSIARKVAKDLNCKLGTVVGYSIRFEDVTSKDTRLKFVTDGILLKEISSKRLTKPCGGETYGMQKIAGYDLIIVDEAHERTINIDFLLGYLKDVLSSKCISTKVLIMSATLNVEKFVEYFNCPTIEIKYRSHKIDHFYLKNPNERYLDVCVQTTIKIVSRYSTGDILVFLTGQEEIEKAYHSLSSRLDGSDIAILKLFSSMPADEQDLIFEKGQRKIILSTNVAETSVTIENIRFVVDSGRVKAKRRSSESAVDFLEVISISKAQAKQRAGRAGRTQPGIVYRIFTLEEYFGMVENPIPEILRSNLSSVVLAMKSLNIDDIYGFDFIDKPPASNICSAVRFLYYLRAIDSKGKITVLGRELSRMPLDPEISMSLYAASQIGCVNSVATIAAFLDYQTPFLDLKSDHPRYKQYKSAKSRFLHPKGDFYMFLSIYELWSRSGFSHFFLKKNFLNTKTMYQVKNVRTQLLRFFPEKSDTSMDIEKAFCCGFFMNVAKRSEKGYKTIFGNNECYIHPGDGLFKKNPKYVLFFELFCIKREYMNHCLEIKAEVLSESVNRIFAFNK